MRRRWRQIEGVGLVELDMTPRRRKPVAPAIRVDSIRPYRHTVTGEMVDSRTKHKRILRERGLIEIGNEYDAWKREVENPDFDDEGRPRWRDPMTAAGKEIYEEFDHGR